MNSFSSRLESLLMQGWLRRGALAWCLYPLSRLFGLLTMLRRQLYRTGMMESAALPVPVIVVGNLFVGGTGKTPLVIWLAEAMRAAGFRPGVISRGYGASSRRPQLVTRSSQPHEVGDEPVLIAGRSGCPVAVGRDRVAAGRLLLKSDPAVDLVIADDGLQHYALRRDIEIILFDARGCGNGWLLPAGPLREPLSRRRDFTVFNADRLPAGLPGDAIRMRLDGNVAERLVDRSQRRPLSGLTSSAAGGLPLRIVAAAGIGNPARFFAMLKAAGLDFSELPLPDHYDFSHNPFAGVVADIILITEKDAVKCSRIDEIKDDPRLWVVPVTAHIDESLPGKIVERLRGYPTA